MNRLTTILSIVFVSLLGVSCTTSKINYISIDVLKPASITFAPEVVNVVVVDNAGRQPANKNHVVFINGTMKEESVSSDSARIVFLQGFTQFMNEDKYFNKVVLYPHHLRSDTSFGKPERITKSEAAGICEEVDADALISLDAFATASKTISDKAYYLESFNELAAKIAFSFRIYDRKGVIQGVPIVYVDSLFWNAKDYASLPRRESAINELALVIAERFTKQFVPSWSQQRRFYYSDNSNEMLVASVNAKEGKWKDAEDIWNALYEAEQNKNKKIRLALNIALANECQDNLDNAVKWIETAFGMFDNGSGSDLALQIGIYSNQLKTRQKNMDLLKTQLGVDGNRQ